MTKLTIDDLKLDGKRALVRVDFNVPMENGTITDDKRIVESLPTIRKILKDGGIPILMSHFGRPKGKRVPEYSLRPVADRLASLLGQPVKFADDCVGEPATSVVANVTTVLGVIIALFLLDWRLAAFSLGLLPLFVLLTVLFFR